MIDVQQSDCAERSDGMAERMAMCVASGLDSFDRGFGAVMRELRYDRHGNGQTGGLLNLDQVEQSLRRKVASMQRQLDELPRRTVEANAS